jgi:hypothetical protein
MATEIWEERQKIEKARRDKMFEQMDEYDTTVYYPAKLALQEKCLAQYGEHTKAKFHDNGLGWTWWYCGRCGAAHNKEKYEDL